MKNLQVGQKVYLKLVSYIGEYNNFETRIKEAKITKIGRKYIYVDVGNPPLRFYLGSLLEVTPYNVEWQLHVNKQDILDNFEAERILKKISKLIVWNKCKLPLEQLRRIEKIIDEKEKRDEK